VYQLYETEWIAENYGSDYDNSDERGIEIVGQRAVRIDAT